MNSREELLDLSAWSRAAGDLFPAHAEKYERIAQILEGSNAAAQRPLQEELLDLASRCEYRAKYDTAVDPMSLLNEAAKALRTICAVTSTERCGDAVRDEMVRRLRECNWNAAADMIETGSTTLRSTECEGK
jgi:hypothetical protein